jgi:PAS domain S-box-containing protein
MKNRVANIEHPDGGERTMEANHRDIYDILIVEDSPTQAKQLEVLFREQGFTVTVAGNGREGIAEAQRSKPKLIISDIHMPEMNGYEMCRSIKQDPALKDVPIILLTQLTEPVDVIESLNVSADCYISKPYNEKHLLLKINELLTAPVSEKMDRPREGVEIDFSGKHFTINSSRSQILTLLISIYEDTVIKNRELISTKETLEDVNEELEKKLHELELSESRFRSLVNTIPDIVYRINPEGMFVFLNEAIERLGYTPEELINTHFSQIIVPTDVAGVYSMDVLQKLRGKITGDDNAPKFFDERRTGTRKTTGLEVRVLPKKGRKIEPGYFEMFGGDAIVVEVNSSGMYDVSADAKQRVLLGTVGVIRDITDRKLMEEKLKMYYENLEAKVRQRTADLKRVNETLIGQVLEREKAEKELQKTLADLKQSQAVLIETEKIAALGTLTAGVAHELNNPMMGILNFVEYCINKTSSDDKRYEVLKDADREVRRCIQIVQNLLTFSRIKKDSEDNFSLDSCEIVLGRVLRLLSYRIEKEGVTFVMTVAEDTPKIMMRVSNMQQVFLNLVSNALEAVKESPKKEISVQIMKDGDFVRIKHTDTGKGISPEDLPKIFDPFFTTRPTGQGTGLGLFISRAIIKSHRGEINCTSLPGSGATFEILLPITQVCKEEDENEWTNTGH